MDRDRRRPHRLRVRPPADLWQGGSAWARNDYRIVDAGVVEGVASATRAGWLGGVGAELGLWPNWSIRAEYNYINFGGRNRTFVDPAGGPPEALGLRQDLHTATLGANYRFTGP